MLECKPLVFTWELVCYGPWLEIASSPISLLKHVHCVQDVSVFCHMMMLPLVVLGSGLQGGL